MGYVTITFYKNIYRGNSIPDDSIQGMLDKASMYVDTITRMKIKKLGGFSNLSDFEKHQVQMAVCHQADHLYEKVGVSGVSSYSVGDISVNFEKSGNYSDSCLQYLNSTRLMYRGL